MAMLRKYCLLRGRGTAMEIAGGIDRQVSATEGAREGIHAFLEKREPESPGGSESDAPTRACPIEDSAENGVCG